ncbi:RNA polymerase sigma factor [Intestinibacter bartlettii]|uniref:RNA polymerase sigma factor n=1 Tax=Intestinibacter bartlettii TaxID=261299 RepID=UPI0008206017|nr:sigma-70 family RNA polymerase sigma factor [Intestinibacter bartlettii]SCJ18074.1 RNA polymerase sigma factor sigM [uncultured Clostridium sp.]
MNKYDKFFHNLCKENYKQIFKYILVMIHDKSVAEDIVQEVFLIAYEKRTVIFSYENKRTFLYKVSKNLTNEYIRKNQKCKIVELNENNIVDEEDLCDLICHKEDEKIDEQKYIADVINELPEDKKELYHLYYIDKVPMKNIAKELNLNEATLRMRFVRLRKDIKNKVKNIKFQNI